jgi:hypothetical protein
MAQEMGAGLGRGQILLGSLPDDGKSQNLTGSAIQERPPSTDMICPLIQLA